VVPAQVMMRRQGQGSNWLAPYLNMETGNTGLIDRYLTRKRKTNPRQIIYPMMSMMRKMKNRLLQARCE